ncbi:hypothetical protein D1872_312240 [compost metagenome]
MRQIADRLNEPLERHVLHFVQHDRKQDRRGEGEDDLQKAQDQRVADNRGELIIVNELVKIPQTHPFAGKDPLNPV